MKELNACTICPNKCGLDRTRYIGPCGADSQLKLAKAFLHQWEEPCISQGAGSGTIFFSGCNMHCVFCQNHDISQECYGKAVTIERLAEIMLELQEQGAANINLITPTPYALHIIEAAKIAKAHGLRLPLIYNTNGYESVETIAKLNGTIDVYLPDIKYFNDRYAVKYSKATDYFANASRAVKAMISQVGYPEFDVNGRMTKGVLIRHMIMPDLLEDSKNILKWITKELGEQAFVSLMCQYTPMHKADQYEEINRKLDDWEYEYIVDYFLKLGMENGFVQDYSSATVEYTPIFDLTGV